MKAVEQLERLKRMNQLIKAECTGTPEAFANILGISQSHLFNLIEDLKLMGAPIKYSRIRQSYLYTIPFDIKLQYSLTFVTENQLKQIFGGTRKNLLYSNFFRGNKLILACEY
jgi:hypothetical protein